MVTSDKDPGTGWSQHEGVWDIFQGGSTGSVAFGVKDVGDDPPHDTGPGIFPIKIMRRIIGRQPRI